MYIDNKNAEQLFRVLKNNNWKKTNKKSKQKKFYITPSDRLTIENDETETMK